MVSAYISARQEDCYSGLKLQADVVPLMNAATEHTSEGYLFFVSQGSVAALPEAGVESGNAHQTALWPWPHRYTVRPED